MILSPQYIFSLLFMIACVKIIANPLNHAENIEHNRIENQYKDQILDAQKSYNMNQKSELEQRKNRRREKQNESERMLAIKQATQKIFIQELKSMLKTAQFTQLSEIPFVPPTAHSYLLNESLLNYDQFRHQVIGGGGILFLYFKDNKQDVAILQKIKNYLQSNQIHYKEKKMLGIIFEITLFPLF
ncbi:MAG: hypothetical protein ACRCVN_02110 [Spirochaetia bacterium]